MKMKIKMKIKRGYGLQAAGCKEVTGLK
jgi:hypothetical protein